MAAARNDGVARSQGSYIAFLDSDDEWLPRKLERQLELFAAHPDFGMVLTDLYFVDLQGRAIGHLQRRSAIPHDGYVLEHVLKLPALVPSSAVMSRAAWDAVGGFDRSLPTAEDVDLFLRLAARHKIGLIEEPLVRYRRSNQGLSNLTRTYSDYVQVMERFVSQYRDALTPRQRDEALFTTYIRNARGLLWNGEYRQALRLFRLSLPLARDLGDLGAISELLTYSMRHAGVKVRNSFL